VTATQIDRVVLTGSDGSELHCQFNPSTVQLGKTSTWSGHPARAAKGGPRQQFVGTGPQTLTAKLMFDDWDTLGQPGSRVPKAVAQLLAWTSATEASQDTAPEPAQITFAWGAGGIQFTGFLHSVQATFTMFGADGTPLRATADIVLQEVTPDPKGTNPTSGGISGRRSAVLADCDSLAAIAYREYGDAAMWRAVAVANGIEDPARVPVGTRLLLPPAAQAAQLSRGGGGSGAR
jgi:hypothetical protein